MNPRPIHYWALCAHPQNYRIMDAVRDCEFDSWNIPRGDVRAGDRAIIWKAKGNDARRGIVALAEVLTDPALGLDPNRAYWVDPTRPDESLKRVTVRYLVPEVLPLWEGQSAPPVVSRLTVGHATGGTVFIVTPAQWDELMIAMGGWPSSTPEIDAAREVIADQSGKRYPPSRGQGYQNDAQLRYTVEQYAMTEARRHFESCGWCVSDVSATQPYDLYCWRHDGKELRVEVKGTTSRGAQVFLTRNEVAHARGHYPHVALFVRAGIRLTPMPDGRYSASDGSSIVLEPWRIDDGALAALAYCYSVPGSELVTP